jgi:hypothetical protein
MAVSLPHPSRVDFEHHIKRLAWYALLANIGLLIPMVGASIPPPLQLAGALAPGIMVIAT